jgi:hypothetical protein
VRDDGERAPSFYLLVHLCLIIVAEVKSLVAVFDVIIT